MRADVGLPTFNPDVAPNSSCATPDHSDIQSLSSPGTTDRNVHVDACLFSASAAPSATVSDVDTTATFELIGAGTISACPDPDGAGPKTAVRPTTETAPSSTAIRAATSPPVPVPSSTTPG